MKVDREKYKQVQLQEAVRLEIIHQEICTINEKILEFNSLGDLVEYLEKFPIWIYARVGLNCWIDVLDKFDAILERCTSIDSKPPNNHKWTMFCDLPQNHLYQRAAISIFTFTKSLMEYSLSRQIFNSSEHVADLLDSSNLNVVLAALDLLFVMINRSSNYLSKLPPKLSEKISFKLSAMGKPFGALSMPLVVDKCIDENFSYASLGIGKFTKKIGVYERKVASGEDLSTTGGEEMYDAKKIYDSFRPQRRITITIDVEKKKAAGLTFNQIFEEILNSYAVYKDEIPALLHGLRWHYYFPDYFQRIDLYSILYLFHTIMIKSHCQTIYKAMPLIGNFVRIISLPANEPKLQRLQSNILKCVALLLHSIQIQTDWFYESLLYSKPYGILPSLFHSKIKLFIEYPPGHPMRPGIVYLQNLEFTLRSLTKEARSAEFIISSHIFHTLLDIIRFRPFQKLLDADSFDQKDLVNFNVQGYLNDYILLGRCVKLLHSLVSSHRELIDEYKVMPLLLDRAAYELECVKFFNNFPSDLKQQYLIPENQASVPFCSMFPRIIHTIVYYAQTSDVGVFEVLFGSESPQRFWHDLLNNHQLFPPVIVRSVIDLLVAVISDEVSDLEKFLDLGIIEKLLNIIFNSQSDAILPTIYLNLQIINNFFHALCLNPKSITLLLSYSPLRQIFDILFYHEEILISRRPRFEFDVESAMYLDSIIQSFQLISSDNTDLKRQAEFQITDSFNNAVRRLLQLKEELLSEHGPLPSLVPRRQFTLSGTKCLANDERFDKRREQYLLQHNSIGNQSPPDPTLVYIDTILSNLQNFIMNIRNFCQYDMLVPFRISELYVKKGRSLKSDGDHITFDAEFSKFMDVYHIAGMVFHSFQSFGETYSTWFFKIIAAFGEDKIHELQPQVIEWLLQAIYQSIVDLHSLQSAFTSDTEVNLQSKIPSIVQQYSLTSYNLKLLLEILQHFESSRLFAYHPDDQPHVSLLYQNIVEALVLLLVQNSKFLTILNYYLGSYFAEPTIEDSHVGFSINDRYFFTAQTVIDALNHDKQVIGFMRKLEPMIIDLMHAFLKHYSGMYDVDNRIGDNKDAENHQSRLCFENLEKMVALLSQKLFEPLMVNIDPMNGNVIPENTESETDRFRILMDIFLYLPTDLKSSKAIEGVLSQTLGVDQCLNLISKLINLLFITISSMSSGTQRNLEPCNRSDSFHLSLEIILVYLEKFLFDNSLPIFSAHSDDYGANYGKIMIHFCTQFHKCLALLSQQNNSAANNLFELLASNRKSLLLFHNFLTSICSQINGSNLIGQSVKTNSTLDGSVNHEFHRLLICIVTYIIGLSVDNFATFHPYTFPVLKSACKRLKDYCGQLSSEIVEGFKAEMQKIVEKFAANISKAKQVIVLECKFGELAKKLSRNLAVFLSLYDIQIFEVIDALNSSAVLHDCLELIIWWSSKEKVLKRPLEHELLLRIESNFIDICMAENLSVNIKSIDKIFSQYIDSHPCRLLQSHPIPSGASTKSPFTNMDDKHTSFTFAKAALDVLNLTQDCKLMQFEPAVMKQVLSNSIQSIAESQSLPMQCKMSPQFNISDLSLVTGTVNGASRILTSPLRTDTVIDDKKADQYPSMEAVSNESFAGIRPMHKNLAIFHIYPLIPESIHRQFHSRYVNTNQMDAKSSVGKPKGLNESLFDMKASIDGYLDDIQQSTENFYEFKLMKLTEENVCRIAEIILESFDNRTTEYPSIDATFTMLPSKLLFLINFANSQKMCKVLTSSKNDAIGRLLRLTFLCQDLKQEREILALISLLLNSLITCQNACYASTLLSNPLIEHLALIKSSSQVTSEHNQHSSSINGEQEADVSNDLNSKCDLATLMHIYAPALSLHPKKFVNAFTRLLNNNSDRNKPPPDTSEDSDDSMTPGPDINFSDFSKRLSKGVVTSFNSQQATVDADKESVGQQTDDYSPDISISLITQLLDFIINGNKSTNASPPVQNPSNSSQNPQPLIGRVSQSLVTHILAEILFQLPHLIPRLHFHQISSDKSRNKTRPFLRVFLAQNILSKDLYGSAILLILTILFRAESVFIINHLLKHLQSVFNEVMHSPVAGGEDESEKSRKLRNLTLLFQTLMAQSNMIMSSGVYMLHQWRITLIWQTMIKLDFFNDLIGSLRCVDLVSTPNIPFANDALLSVEFISEVFGNYMRFSGTKQTLLEALSFDYPYNSQNNNRNRNLRNDHRTAENFSHLVRGNENDINRPQNFIHPRFNQDQNESVFDRYDLGPNVSPTDEHGPLIEVDFDNSEYISDSLSTTSINSMDGDEDSLYSMESPVNNLDNEANGSTIPNLEQNQHGSSGEGTAIEQNTEELSSQGYSSLGSGSTLLPVDDLPLDVHSGRQEDSNTEESEENDLDYEISHEPAGDSLNEDQRDQMDVHDSNPQDYQPIVGYLDDVLHAEENQEEDANEELFIDMENESDDEGSSYTGILSVDNFDHDNSANFSHEFEDESRDDNDFLHESDDDNYDLEEFYPDDHRHDTRNHHRNGYEISSDRLAGDSGMLQDDTIEFSLLRPTSTASQQPLDNNNNDIVTMLPNLLNKYDQERFGSNTDQELHKIYLNMVSYYRPSNNLRKICQDPKEVSPLPMNNKPVDYKSDLKSFLVDCNYIPARSILNQNRLSLLQQLTKEAEKSTPLFTVQSITENLFQMPGILQFLPLSLNRATDLVHIVYHANQANSISFKIRSIAFVSVLINHIINLGSTDYQSFIKLILQMIHVVNDIEDTKKSVEDCKQPTPASDQLIDNLATVEANQVVRQRLDEYVSSQFQNQRDQIRVGFENVRAVNAGDDENNLTTPVMPSSEQIRNMMAHNALSEYPQGEVDNQHGQLGIPQDASNDNLAENQGKRSINSSKNLNDMQKSLIMFYEHFAKYTNSSIFTQDNLTILLSLHFYPANRIDKSTIANIFTQLANNKTLMCWTLDSIISMIDFAINCSLVSQKKVVINSQPSRYLTTNICFDDDCWSQISVFVNLAKKNGTQAMYLNHHVVPSVIRNLTQTIKSVLSHGYKNLFILKNIQLSDSQKNAEKSSTDDSTSGLDPFFQIFARLENRALSAESNHNVSGASLHNTDGKSNSSSARIKFVSRQKVSENFMISLLNSLLSFLESSNSNQTVNSSANPNINHETIAKSLIPLTEMIHEATKIVVNLNKSNIIEAFMNRFDEESQKPNEAETANAPNGDVKKLATISGPKLVQGMQFFYQEFENQLPRFLKILEQQYFGYERGSVFANLYAKLFQVLAIICNPVETLARQFMVSHLVIAEKAMSSVIDECKVYFNALQHLNTNGKRYNNQDMYSGMPSDQVESLNQGMDYEDQTYYDRFQNRQIIITSAATSRTAAVLQKPMEVNVDSYLSLMKGGNNCGSNQFFINNILDVLKQEIRRLQLIKTNQIVTHGEVLERLKSLVASITRLEQHKLHTETLPQLMDFISKNLDNATAYIEPLIPCIRTYFQTLALGTQLNGMLKYDTRFSIENEACLEAMSNAASCDASAFPLFNRLINFANEHTRLLRYIIGETQNSFVYLQATRLLIKHSQVFDFHTKQSYFYAHLLALSNQSHETIEVGRDSVFHDSFRFFNRLEPFRLHNKFVVKFAGESGQDEGGVLREWYSILSRDIFNRNYCLFETNYKGQANAEAAASSSDMSIGHGYRISPASDINPLDLEYFKFVGRLIARAIFDKKHMDCCFTRSLYKHILDLPIHFQDMVYEDPELYDGLKFLLDNQIDPLQLGLTFSLETNDFGQSKVIDLIYDGQSIEVTDMNKHHYITLMTEAHLKGRISKQIEAFVGGFHEVIPKNLITIFNEQELELLIAGLKKYDLNDLEANTEYLNGYSASSPQVKWLFEILRSYDDNLQALFFHFVTGSSRIPIQGFAYLQGMNGVQKFAISLENQKTERLPSAHTCFNQIDIPPYESKEKFEKLLLIAITEGQYGFGMA